MGAENKVITDQSKEWGRSNSKVHNKIISSENGYEKHPILNWRERKKEKEWRREGEEARIWFFSDQWHPYWIKAITHSLWKRKQPKLASTNPSHVLYCHTTLSKSRPEGKNKKIDRKSRTESNLHLYHSLSISLSIYIYLSRATCAIMSQWCMLCYVASSSSLSPSSSSVHQLRQT